MPVLAPWLSWFSEVSSSGGITYTYQWKRDGVPIIGAFGKTYIPTGADVGHNLEVDVTATNAYGGTTVTTLDYGPIFSVSSTAVPKASYKPEIAWGQGSGGLFRFGISLFGSSSDRLAASSWSESFAGPNADLTVDGRDAAITRGRDNDLTTLRAGQEQLTVRDPYGVYNPENPASPIAGLIDTDLPTRFTANYLLVDYPLYYGFLTDLEADPSGRGTVHYTAIDFLDKLDRQSPVIAPLPAGYTTGQIIGAILDWFLWTDPAMRRLSIGDTINASWTRADGSRSALALIEELMKAERGITFVDKAGAITYIDRHTRYTSVSVGTIDRVMTAFPVGKSNANIVNQWTVQRTDMAGNAVGTPQTAGDLASQRKHGTIADSIETPFLNNDAQALNLAQYLLLRTVTSASLVYEIPLNIADSATMIQVLSRDIGDRVTMTIAPRNMAPFTGDFFIESISHTVSTRPTGPRHACTWRVSAVPATLPFRFGVSSFGSADVLSY